MGGEVSNFSPSSKLISLWTNSRQHNLDFKSTEFSFEIFKNKLSHINMFRACNYYKPFNCPLLNIQHTDKCMQSITLPPRLALGGLPALTTLARPVDSVGTQR